MTDTIEYYPMQLVGEDAEVVVLAVNQGIDSRLEGFTRSKFEWVHHTAPGQISQAIWDRLRDDQKPPVIATKLHCLIHPDEMQILIRRLVEISELPDEDISTQLADEAFCLADDIVESWLEIDLWDLEEKAGLQFPVEI